MAVAIYSLKVELVDVLQVQCHVEALPQGVPRQTVLGFQVLLCERFGGTTTVQSADGLPELSGHRITTESASGGQIAAPAGGRLFVSQGRK